MERAVRRDHRELKLLLHGWPLRLYLSGSHCKVQKVISAIVRLLKLKGTDVAERETSTLHTSSK
jgi:hypothetical protein